MWPLSISHDCHVTIKHITWLSCDYHMAITDHHITVAWLYSPWWPCYLQPLGFLPSRPPWSRPGAGCVQAAEREFLNSPLPPLYSSWSGALLGVPVKITKTCNAHRRRDTVRFTEWHQRLLIGRQMRLEKRPFCCSVHPNTGAPNVLKIGSSLPFDTM